MRYVSLIAPIPALVASAASAQTADLKFAYTYPAEARAIPALKAWLDAQAAHQRARYAAMAAADRRDSAKDARPFHPYEYQRTWKVVADTPRFLSLSAEGYAYTGGAHGNTSFDALVWDKAARRRLAPLAFFAGPRALAAAIRAPFCRQLDAERAKKRGGEKATLPEFDQCIDPSKETLILGSASRRRFDRIGVLIAPYDAGPYAEGSYEVTLPVTPAVLAAVKPAYRVWFATGTP